MQGGDATADIESAVDRALRAGRLDEATTLAVRGYGPAVYGFLCATLRDETAAAEAFAQLCEDVWRGIGSFRGECTFRTWMYALARNACHRQRRDPFRRRTAGVEADAWLDRIAAEVRTTTLSFLRTDVRDEVANLRTQLDPDEQMLLILRIDRGMSWDEVADVFHDAAPASAAERTRRAAALRKRFERAKERLRKLAARTGLLARAGRDS